MMDAYGRKFDGFVGRTLFDRLDGAERERLRALALHYRFSFQEFRQLVEMDIDFLMWGEPPVSQLLDMRHPDRRAAFSAVRKRHTQLRERPTDYRGFDTGGHRAPKFTFEEKRSDTLALGMCPVASPNTRCCNLMTLDAVESCGFDCSYCSIQSFYNQDRIGFDANLAEKLDALELDPDVTYHIGTGQSSDSLMWGNRAGILDALFAFARRNPNVILEFKSKSDNVSYLLEHEVPRNIVCTFSLNTPTIVESEEHLSAPLHKRLAAARALADKGVLVGFHFHPIVQYEGYLEEYGALYRELTGRFTPDEVVMVSFGTLTFIRPVIRQLRERGFRSRILQIPMAAANGKYSYPLDVKREMFRHAYDAFAPWHGRVFFYLCMEDHALWRDVFGYEYATNDHFEEEMLRAYREKIDG
jgi:spore photoproduct lyase